MDLKTVFQQLRESYLIKGIANDVNKHDKYFIILSEINQIIMEFCEAFDIEDCNTKTNMTS